MSNGYPSPGLQSRKSLLGIPRQIHVDGCSHPGTKVGWAGVDEAILGVKHELPARKIEMLKNLKKFKPAGLLPDAVLHGLDASGQPGEDALHIASHLHRDDPQLVLLVHLICSEVKQVRSSSCYSHPGEESLVLVVENASSLWPVSLHPTCLMILITYPLHAIL